MHSPFHLSQPICLLNVGTGKITRYTSHVDAAKSNGIPQHIFGSLQKVEVRDHLLKNGSQGFMCGPSVKYLLSKKLLVTLRSCLFRFTCQKTGSVHTFTSNKQVAGFLKMSEKHWSAYLHDKLIFYRNNAFKDNFHRTFPTRRFHFELVLPCSIIVPYEIIKSKPYRRNVLPKEKREFHNPFYVWDIHTNLMKRFETYKALKEETGVSGDSVKRALLNARTTPVLKRYLFNESLEDLKRQCVEFNLKQCTFTLVDLSTQKTYTFTRVLDILRTLNLSPNTWNAAVQEFLKRFVVCEQPKGEILFGKVKRRAFSIVFHPPKIHPDVPYKISSKLG